MAKMSFFTTIRKKYDPAIQCMVLFHTWLDKTKAFSLIGDEPQVAGDEWQVADGKGISHKPELTRYSPLS